LNETPIYYYYVYIYNDIQYSVSIYTNFFPIASFKTKK